MAFAFNPNGSDHNGIDDAVEKSTGSVKIVVGPHCDTEGGPPPFPECGAMEGGIP